MADHLSDLAEGAGRGCCMQGKVAGSTLTNTSYFEYFDAEFDAEFGPSARGRLDD